MPNRLWLKLFNKASILHIHQFVIYSMHRVAKLKPYQECLIPGQILNFLECFVLVWTFWTSLMSPSVFPSLCIFQWQTALRTCQVKHLVWGDALWSLMASARGHINGRDDKSEQWEHQWSSQQGFSCAGYRKCGSSWPLNPEAMCALQSALSLCSDIWCPSDLHLLVTDKLHNIYCGIMV